MKYSVLIKITVSKARLNAELKQGSRLMSILKQIYINYVSLVYRNSLFGQFIECEIIEIRDGKPLLSPLLSPPSSAEFFPPVYFQMLRPLSFSIAQAVRHSTDTSGETITHFNISHRKGFLWYSKLRSPSSFITPT